MAAWRRRALELIPELRDDLQRPDYTICLLYVDLLPMVRTAHDSDEIELLRRIYGYAEWCLHQTAEEFWNTAGYSFYQNLFDDPASRRRVVPWLSPYVIDKCWRLWEIRLDPHELAEVKMLIEKRKEYRYRELDVV